MRSCPRSLAAARPLARALLVAVALGASACNENAAGEARPADPPAVYVETVPVVRGDVEVAVEAVGTLQPHQRVEIRARNEGTVAAVFVTDGEAVAAGAPLVQLDTTKLAAEVRLREASLTAARTRFANADTAFKRARDLFARGFIPQQEHDDAKARTDEAAAAVEEAEAALAVARELLRDASIEAPIDGTASAALVDPGDYLRNGDHLLTIIDADPIEVEFSIPEEHLARLAIGTQVSVHVPSYPDDRFAGTISYVAPEVSPETHTIHLKARIPNADGRLRPGQFAIVRTVLAVHESATLVPEEAIVSEGAGTCVYLVDGGRAVRREVDLGVRQRDRVEITSGLAGGETVIVSGQMRLRDGMAVQTAASAPAREG
jgi:membrane fusion protein (multidrug efflux system)